ncbi:GPI-anchored protein LLG2, partial [Cucurbita argyrosperma subsp. sororia]
MLLPLPSPSFNILHCGRLHRCHRCHGPRSCSSFPFSIITSKCKGPEYPANLRCSALEEFGCPYANYINDLTNNCASIMFTYIHLYGNYPSGLSLPPSASKNPLVFNALKLTKHLPTFILCI